MKRILLDVTVLALTISLVTACSNGEIKKADAKPKKEIVKDEQKDIKSVNKNNDAKDEYGKLPISREDFIANYKLEMTEDSLPIINETDVREGNSPDIYTQDLNSSVIGDPSAGVYVFNLVLNKNDETLSKIGGFGSFGIDTFITTIKALGVFSDPKVSQMFLDLGTQIEKEGEAKQQVILDNMIIEIEFSAGAQFFTITGTQK